MQRGKEMKAKLSDGFEVEIIETSLDDWEFLELLDEIDQGNTGAVVRVARILLGTDGVKALKDHFREKEGRVSVEKMVTALTELMESVSQLKN